MQTLVSLNKYNLLASNLRFLFDIITSSKIELYNTYILYLI
jgi:hypothetical protein